MILVAGGTGHLGVELVSLLTAHGHRLRILSRHPEQARQLLGDALEFAAGDARDQRSLEEAATGVEAVISAMTGFGPGGHGPRAVDYEGNLNLIRTAEAAGAQRFILLSIRGADANHPMELLRMKHRAEEALRASGLDWRILRPTVFMELWAGIVGDPLVKTGKATVFGRGDHPVNFISTRDVARFVELALVDPGLSRQTIDIGGPENVTFNELVSEVARAIGRTARVRHVPISLMRLTRALTGPLKPDLAGMIEAGIVTDTMDMSFDAAGLQRRFPQIELARMTDVVRRRFSADGALFAIAGAGGGRSPRRPGAR